MSPSAQSNGCGPSRDMGPGGNEKDCGAKYSSPHSLLELSQIVACYGKRPSKQKIQLDEFKRETSLRSAVERAALAVGCDGKRFNHQRRIRQEAIDEAKTQLLSILPKLSSCRDFDELFRTIEAQIGHIYGIGPLYIYDTALRIGAKLDRLPDMVYLHAGTRLGAKKLGLPLNEEALSHDQLPPELRDLPMHEVEDMLCIYKHNFRPQPQKPRA